MISWFARNSVAANLLMLAVIVAGGWTLWAEKIPLEVFPEIPSRMVNINVPYPASDPEEVEEMIVVKIEEAISTVAGIKEINSLASSSGASIWVEVEEGLDPRQVLEDIKIRTDAIPEFPEEAEKPVIQVEDERRSVITVVIAADMSERDLRRLGEQVRDELASQPGISYVSLAGSRPLEIAIEVSEETLRKYGLTLESISSAIRNAAIDLPAGVVRTESGDVSIRTKGRAYTGDDYANVVVLTRPDGSKLTLGEIAKIEDGFNENLLYARLNGKRCVVVNVMREGNQNAITIAENVKKYVEEARHRMPDGVSIEFWNDRAKIVKGRIDLLLDNARSSLILVLLCIGLFLRLESVFWIVVGLPVSFLGAFALMPYFDITINISTLFGFILVLGIVVDDAIVISEHVDTLRRQGMPPLQAAIEGTKRMAVPITFGVLTTVMAFLPMVFEASDMGKMFVPIALVFIMVMLIALVETKIILPAHLAHPIRPLEKVGHLLDPLHRGADRALEGFVNRVYRPSLRFCLEHRYTVLACSFGGLAILCGMFFSGRIQYVQFPRIASERIEARLTMLEGTPFEVTDGHINRIYEIAEQMRKEYVGPDGTPVIRHIIATTGTTRLTSSSGSGGQAHIGEVNIETYGPEERTMKVNTVDMANEWRKRIGTIVGAEEVSFRSEIFRAGDPINIQLTGTNPTELLELSSKIKDQLAKYPGVFDINDSLDTGRNEIQLRLKPEARQFGVTVSDLARQVRQAFYGSEVQRIQRGRNELKVMLRYPRDERRSLSTLETMRVRTTDGLEIPFNRVAEMKVGKGFSAIRRVNRERALNITADVDKKSVDLAALRTDIGNHLEEFMRSHPQVKWSFEGEARAERESATAGVVMFFIVLFGLYCLTAIPFKSYFLPFVVLVVIPFGVVGAILGHLFHGFPVSQMSILGMLAVSGVIVNDTLVLVDEINHRKQTDGILSAVREGGAARFRAIFLTQITTFFGLVPLIFDGTWIAKVAPFFFSQGAQSTHAQFLTPVSVAMGYGSLFATVICLYLVPMCYMALNDVGQVILRWWNAIMPPSESKDENLPVVEA
ncbi:multidrug efflux pump subunit AcrB [Roseimicrobium gellanilyticum]|uniref:Multidrug efflux pump subunit AcrB n=1 Tax=Roseimicrobium gellanilyticum TaxID=748857 RepID=A0A366H6U6_9BACT|nr:efflux RND transporter permease subunit [Roseimicrobium gellanilyticum]RBP37724.1 multidrug efflux pump subunit AcrB [Roseimicrobium gellanilyticum]